MEDKMQEQLLTGWLNSVRRQVKQTGNKTSAFIAACFHEPIELVWKAWTDQEQLGCWLAKVTGNLKEGKEIALDVGAPYVIASTLLKLTPKETILFTWSYPGRVTGEIAIRFFQDGNSTCIELEHYSTDRSNWWYGAGSGWESALVRLSLLLSGRDPASISNETFDKVLGPLWLAAGKSISASGD